MPRKKQKQQPQQQRDQFEKEKKIPNSYKKKIVIWTF